MYTILILALCFFVGWLIWQFLIPRERSFVEYDAEDLPTANFSYREFDDDEPFNEHDSSLSSQSPAWCRSMRAYGDVFRFARIRSIYFVHGTFVGNDPMGVINTMKIVYPSIDTGLSAKISKLIKSQSDRVFKDSGNYTQEYVKLFESALGGKLPCYPFNWSSGNHHIARLVGACRLIQVLATDIRSNQIAPLEKILLNGHSHAGQVFALLCMLLQKDATSYELIKIAEEAGENSADIQRGIMTINQVSLDFATFGAPIIYRWPDSGYYRLCNIINHRGNHHMAGSLKGLLHTKDGDYIQQLGIRGTDIIATTTLERKLNEKLDLILGEGRNIGTWAKNIKVKMRLPPFGKTFLVNYKDDSRAIPNFLSTFFGHGIYTRHKTMLYNTRLIAEHFYKSGAR